MDPVEMEREFKASFSSYVSERSDARKTVLILLSKLSPGSVVERLLLLPYDLAALMTCAVYVDPSSPACKALFASYKEYKTQCKERDPEKREFNPQFTNLEIFLDSSIPELKSFLETLYAVPNGKMYLWSTLICLSLAHKIPQMIPNLWKPTTKSGAIRCLFSA